MKNRNWGFLLRWLYLFFLIAAIIISVIQLVSYSFARSNFSYGLSIAGIPVGGLNSQDAAQRILQVYTSPIELHYSESVILLDPSSVTFKVDVEGMLAAADLQRTNKPFWVGFWEFLWSNPSSQSNIPLISSISENNVRNYLQTEISPRYDKLPTSAILIPGTTDFLPGEPGQVIDLERSTASIINALKSPTTRSIYLSSRTSQSGRPSLENLELIIMQIAQENSFDGIIGVFLIDLQTGEELHFGYQNYAAVSVNPDIAFTASSTIKIPIMVSIFKEFSGNLDNSTQSLMLEMLKESENPAADELMQLLDINTGPVLVTADIEKLGLTNTFIAGYFFENAPNLLPFRSTPANSRFDLTTDPDWYSQTSPSDMGSLLEDIYLCAEAGGGSLVATFPGKFTKQSCSQMIQYLKEDKIGLLIEGGVPDGTSVAHKHGWVVDVSTGVYHDISDVGIIYSPGGNYLLSIYAYHPVQIIWEYPTSRLGAARMFADISRVVFNYFNIQQ